MFAPAGEACAGGGGSTRPGPRSGLSVRTCASGGACGVCGAAMRPRRGRLYCSGACRARASRASQAAALLVALDRVTRAVAEVAVSVEAARYVAAESMRHGGRR